MSSSEIPLRSFGTVEIEARVDATGNGDPNDDPRGASSSLQGIRWLLLVGGLVVSVSVIRLVAAEWHQLSASVQFLLLVVGALGVFGSAEVLRQRLHLPLAATALQGLFVALVPLLAWGAAHQGLASSVSGTLVVVPGLLALLLACRRLLRRQLGYHGVVYVWVLGGLLLATPYIGVVGELVGGDATFFVGFAALGGWAMRWAGRHINRFFFHRDRRQGVDRPLSLLPFGLLLVVYLASVLALPVAGAWLAVPLAFAAVALIDCGEEFYQALVAARGAAVKRWPRRSVALLVAGFSLLVVALGLAPASGWMLGWAVVSALATWRLLAWGLRYRSTAAYAAGLLAGMMAYHAAPALVPDLAKQAYQWLLMTLGVEAGGAAVVSLSGVGQLALLVASAVTFGEHSSRQMSRLHHFLILLQATVVLVAGLSEPTALRWVALSTLPLMVWAALALRRRQLLPWVYAALASTALAWGWQPGSGNLWSERGAFLLLTASLLYLGVGWGIDRRRRPRGPVLGGGGAGEAVGVSARRRLWRPWVVWPLLALLVPVGISALPWRLFGFDPTTAPMMQLLLVPAFALAMVLLRRPWLGVLVAASLSLSIWGGLDQLSLTNGAMALAAQLVLLTAWVWQRRSAPATAILWRWASHCLVVMNGAMGLVLLGLAWMGSNVTLEALVLLWLGAYLFDTVARQGALGSRKSPESVAGLLLQPAMALILLFPTVQLWAWGVDGWMPLLLSLGLTFVALTGAVHGRFGRWLALRYGIDVGQARLTLEQGLVVLRRIWRLTAAASCLLWVGPWAMLVALLLAAEAVLRALGRGHGPPPVDAEDPLLAVTALPFLQLVGMLLQGLASGSEYLLPTLLSADGRGTLATMLAVLLWMLALAALSARGVARPIAVLRGGELLAAASALWGLAVTTGSDLAVPSWGHAAAALAFACWNGHRAWSESRGPEAWNGQAWLLLTVFHGFAAGWLEAMSPSSALWLVSLAVALESLRGWARRRLPAEVPQDSLVASLAAGATLWALAAGVVSCAAVLIADGSWWSVLPAMLGSVLFALRARRGDAVELSSGLACGLFAVAFCAAVYAVPFMGPELYFLGPGIALMLLSWLLSPRIGNSTRSHLFTVGAVAAYGTPMMGLLGELGWVWQCVLLLAAIAFGASSFRLRSRSLLTVSTAALIIDLVFFVVKLRRTEPTVLWILGIAFGLSLMGGAAYLEHRREAVEQQLRIWGHELKSWS